MSPESLDGGDYSEKADIWSLGITAIEMHDGYPPHNDEHIMRAMLLITQNDPPTLENPSIASPEFNNFLARCLKKNKDDRASAEELIQDPFITKFTDHEETLREMVTEYKILRTKNEAKKQEEIAKEKYKPKGDFDLYEHFLSGGETKFDNLTDEELFDNIPFVVLIHL